MCWQVLGEPWREALELAWDSFREGGIALALGAVLTNSTGAIIGLGRNQRFGRGQGRNCTAYRPPRGQRALWRPARGCAGRKITGVPGPARDGAQGHSGACL
jgi:hypothetical protein